MPRKIVRGQNVNPELIRRARELRRDMTPEEKILWHELRNGALGVHFRRQQVIAGYIADFYCHSAALVIELDGSPHEKQRGYDHMRDRTFARMGIRTIRITNHELRTDTPAVIARVRAALT